VKASDSETFQQIAKVLATGDLTQYRPSLLGIRTGEIGLEAANIKAMCRSRVASVHRVRRRLSTPLSVVGAHKYFAIRQTLVVRYKIATYYAIPARTGFAHPYVRRRLQFRDLVGYRTRDGR